MKIRSNMDRVWSLAGIRFEPGMVITFDILKCNDLRQLKAVVEEIRKGNITVVEQDDYFKPASITKIEQPQVIKKESQEDIVVVTRGGTFTDEIPKDVLTENTIQSVPVTIDVEKQSEPVVGEGNIKNESSTEAGFVVLPGKKPGEGQLKSVSEVIQEKTDEIADVLKDAAKDLEELNKKEEVIEQVPEDVDKILKMKANERKLYIAKLDDKELLLKISKYTKVKTILNIINQRLEELK